MCWLWRCCWYCFTTRWPCCRRVSGCRLPPSRSFCSPFRIACPSKASCRHGPKWQWALSIGLLPLSLMFFHRLSIISPIANLLAVPWVGLLVTPLSLIALPVHIVHAGAGELLLQLADGMLALMNMILGFRSEEHTSELQSPC